MEIESPKAGCVRETVFNYKNYIQKGNRKEPELTYREIHG